MREGRVVVLGEERLTGLGEPIEHTSTCSRWRGRSARFSLASPSDATADSQGGVTSQKPVMHHTHHELTAGLGRAELNEDLKCLLLWWNNDMV